MENFVHSRKSLAWAYNSQYHSVMTSHNICRQMEDQEGFRYNLVLRVRPDHIFLDPLPLQEILPDSICVPSTNGHGDTMSYKELGEMLADPVHRDIIEDYCKEKGIDLSQWITQKTAVHYFDDTQICNDQFAISSSENMYQYSRLLQYIHKNIEDDESVLYRDMMSPEGISIERMLFLHIQEFSKIKTLNMGNRLSRMNIPLNGKIINIMKKYLDNRDQQ